MLLWPLGPLQFRNATHHVIKHAHPLLQCRHLGLDGESCHIGLGRRRTTQDVWVAKSLATFRCRKPMPKACAIAWTPQTQCFTSFQVTTSEDGSEAHSFFDCAVHTDQQRRPPIVWYIVHGRLNLLSAKVHLETCTSWAA